MRIRQICFSKSSLICEGRLAGLTRICKLHCFSLALLDGLL
jgi:hypothetical protein